MVIFAVWLSFDCFWRMVHWTNRQKHSKPLVYQSSQVYQDCTKNSQKQPKHSQNSTKMTIGVPVVTCLPRLYQSCTNSVPKTVKRQSKQHKNDHWTNIVFAETGVREFVHFRTSSWWGLKLAHDQLKQLFIDCTTFIPSRGDGAMCNPPQCQHALRSLR